MQAVPIGPGQPIDTTTQGNKISPAIATDAQGNYIVAWIQPASNGESPNGIFARRYQADGTPIDSEDLRLNSTQAGINSLSVSMTKGANYSHYSVARAIDPSGDREGHMNYSEVRQTDAGEFAFIGSVNSEFNHSQAIDTVFPSQETNGFPMGFATWMSKREDGSGHNIFVDDFGSTLAESATQVNTLSNESYENPAIATDADGNMVITWEQISNDGRRSNIYARRFDQSRNPIPAPDGSTREFLVSSVQRDTLRHPDVAMAPNGDFIITWESSEGDPSGDDADSIDIYAQRFRANGTPRGVEFRVNRTTLHDQQSPQVSADSDGNFVITWVSINEDTAESQVFAQHFRSTGERWGTEINVSHQSHQPGFDLSKPVVAVADNRDFLIAWESSTDNQTDIFVRRFDTPNRPITGTPFNDELIGDDGVDRISGLAGNDTLKGLGGVDALDGGDGDDTLEGGDGQDSLFGRAGNDKMKGGNGPDTIIGGEGDDTMFGDADNDYFQGNNGDDRMFGGTGDDVMDAGNGNDHLNGGDGNDRLIAGDGNDSLEGWAGDDVLSGGAGKDFLRGRSGRDRMEGGAGDDTYVVEDTGDIVIEGNYGTLTGHTDLVYSSLPTYTLPDNVENLSLGVNDDDIVYTGINGIGNAGNNILGGNSRDNRLEGCGGSDELNGRLGNDTLLGNDGNDFLFGNEGDDILKGGDGVDQLEDQQGNNKLYGGGGDDYLWAGSGNDYLNGGGGHDRLDGDNGSDRLQGKSGNDVLMGHFPSSFDVQSTRSSSSEIDKLIGGHGSDHFVLGYERSLAYRDDGKSGTKSYARIQDFHIGKDLIHLGEGNYVLSKSPINKLKGTGIFLETQMGSSTSRDLIGIVQNIHPHKLDLSNTEQFSIGGSFPITSEHWQGF